MDVFSMNFGRTEVILGASKAKFCRESFGEVRFCVAPQKPGKNDERRTFSDRKKITKTFFGVEKSNVGNRLKRVFPNFQAERSLVRGVNGRSKFSKKIEIREAFFPFFLATDGNMLACDFPTLSFRTNIRCDCAFLQVLRSLCTCQL